MYQTPRGGTLRDRLRDYASRRMLAFTNYEVATMAQVTDHVYRLFRELVGVTEIALGHDTPAERARAVVDVLEEIYEEITDAVDLPVVDGFLEAAIENAGWRALEPIFLMLAEQAMVMLDETRNAGPESTVV